MHLSIEQWSAVGSIASGGAALFSLVVAIVALKAAARSAAAAEVSNTLSKQQAMLARLNAQQAKAQVHAEAISGLAAARRDLFGIWKSSTTIQQHSNSGANPGNIHSSLEPLTDRVAEFNRLHEPVLLAELAHDQEDRARTVIMMGNLEESLKASRNSWSFSVFNEKYSGSSGSRPDQLDQTLLSGIKVLDGRIAEHQSNRSEAMSSVRALEGQLAGVAVQYP